MLSYSIGKIEANKLVFSHYPPLICCSVEKRGWVVSQSYRALLLCVVGAALALLWAMAFALAMGRGGFALMMFNKFKKKERKKEESSFRLTIMQLLPC